MKGLVLMALMLTAYFVREVWTLYAFRREVIYPFPFALDQYIHRQTYWSMFLGYGFAVIVAIILWQGLSANKVFWFCVFIFWRRQA